MSPLKIKVLPKPVVQMKVMARFPSAVYALSPILLDRAGGNYTISFDANSLSSTFATAAQGALADTAVQSVVAGSNVTVDNTDPANPVISAAADYATKADVEAATISGSLGFIRTAGYSAAGDGGGALYKRVVSEPSHEGKIQSDDGAWWEIAELIINVRMLGAILDGVTDDTLAFRQAITVGKPVYFPSGNAYVRDIITLGLDQCMFGDGRMKSRFVIKSDFNLSALGVIRMAAGEPSSELYDVGFFFDQPTAVGTTRADLIQYPPAIYARDAARFIIDRIRIERGWDGIDWRNNSGGAKFGFLEFGCFNKGMQADGALDWCSIDRYHFWPFGMGSSSSALGVIFRDGSTIAAELGRVDGLFVSAFLVIRAKIIFTSNATNGLPFAIAALYLDSNAQLVVNGGFIQCGHVSTSADSAAPGPSIAVNSPGNLNINYLAMFNSYAAVNSIELTGGRLNIQGGRGAAGSTGHSLLLQTGGRLLIGGTEFIPADAARTVGFIKQTAGQIRIHDCVFTAQPSGSGNAVEIGADDQHNSIQGNELTDWGVSFPANANLGAYGSNLTKPVTWQPSVIFVTLGDFVPTYITRAGRYYREPGGIRWECVLEFSTNAFTTASGAFRIIGLPALSRGVSSAPVTMGPVGGVDLSSGYTALAALISASTSSSPNGHIGFNQIGDNLARGDVTIANIKPSVSNIFMSLSGFIPTGL